MNIWKTLQMEATDDVAKIKKAYAQLIKQYNPEEHMQQFLEIRKAYQQALALAEKQEPGTDTAPPTVVTIEEMPVPHTVEPAPVQRDFVNQTAEDDAAYADCEAMQQLRRLYFDQKCNDKNLWIKYFASAPFLDVFRKAGFAAKLKQELLAESAQPAINKAFFSLLPIVYGLAQANDKDVLAHGVAGEVSFEGIEHIYALLQQADVPVKMNDNTNIALSKGYEDYRALCSLTQSGVWNDAVALSFGKLISRYVIAYIYDKIPQNRMSLSQTDYIPRHITALQLLNHYFASAQLPQQAYSILWDKLDLRNAKMGRNQVLYGKLRAICLEKYPQLDTIEKESFTQFRTEAQDFFGAFSRQEGSLTEEDLDAFFERDDLKRAFRNRTFVEEDIFRWTSYRFWPVVLGRIVAHCMADEQVVLREELIGRAQHTLYLLQVETARKEDEAAPILEQPASVADRAFFRYLLYVSLQNAYSNRYSIALGSALQQEFPFSRLWAERFLEYDHSTDSFGTPRRMSVALGDNRLDIIFHLYHISYALDDQPVYAPFIRFESLQQLEDDLLFWMVLPLSFTAMEQQGLVYEEILRRLGKLAFLQQAPVALFADCITGQICQSYEGDYTPPVLVINRERFKVLYTCVIYTSDLLAQVYKTAENGQRFFLTEEVGSDLENAIWLGQRQLDAATSHFDGTQLRDECLPDRVLAAARHSPPLDYTGEEVTLERVKELLLGYRDQKLKRLELRWQERILVLLEAENQYVCFGFDEKKHHRFTYLSRPDIYRSTNAEDVVYQSFLYGQLPSYVLHATPLSILNSIHEIMVYISGKGYLSHACQQDWAQEVYLHTEHKYAIDKCLLAGFPIAPPDLPLFDRFVLSKMPTQLQTTAPDGRVEQIRMTPANRSLVSELLLGFLRGRLTGLVLRWAQPLPEAADFERRIELLGSDGSYAMLYSDSGSEQVQVLVADVNTYLNLNTRKYQTQTMGSYKIPHFMVHHDLYRIRGYLNVLLESIAAPTPILHIFGEFGLLPDDKK